MIPVASMVMIASTTASKTASAFSASQLCLLRSKRVPFGDGGDLSKLSDITGGCQLFLGLGGSMLVSPLR